MAIHAHSTPAPVDHRALLPPPPPLPSLPDAFTRRRAIFGAVTTAALLTAPAQALERPDALSPVGCPPRGLGRRL